MSSIPVVPIERVKEQVHARARTIDIMRIILELQPDQHWTDEQSYGLMACYLADSLEAMTRKVIEAANRQIVEPMEIVRDGKTVRTVFLPNAAREMYDALKVVRELYGCPGPQTKMDKTFMAVEAAIAKAEGRG
jgi:hypothetical protein